MKAGVLYGVGDLRIEDRPDPQFGADDLGRQLLFEEQLHRLQPRLNGMKVEALWR